MYHKQINAPPEYTNRARDEIRRKLAQKPHKSSPLRNTLNSIGETQRVEEFAPVQSAYQPQSDVASIYSRQESQYSQATQYTNFSGNSQQSFQSRSGSGNSIFSRQDSISTMGIQVSQNKPQFIRLQDALPRSFHDMYSPELLLNQPLINGRPMFTKRNLIDWDLNDIRSLLIVCEIPQGYDQLPTITDPMGFRYQLLPLDASDDYIIQVLCSSDLYAEAKLDNQFKLQSARYTVTAARKRHLQLLEQNGINVAFPEMCTGLTKPEWRNVIENYMLNLAVEVECRSMFKRLTAEVKKQVKPDMPPPMMRPSKINLKGNKLLKKALLGKEETRSLSKEEKQTLWRQCQVEVYKKLGLDWEPDYN